MDIDRLGPSASEPYPRAPAPTGGADFAAALPASRPIATPAAIPTHPTLAALLAVQETPAGRRPDGPARKAAIRKGATRLIDALHELQCGLLGDAGNGDALEKLAAALDDLPASQGPIEGALIGALQVRASVEIARLDVSRRRR